MEFKVSAMKKDKNKKDNLPAESMQDRFLRAFRQQLRDKEITKIVVNGVVVRMPLGIILSRMKPTKLQMNIITTIMKVIGKNVANELQKESLGSLFSKAEFGEDENSINFVIHEREFGIPRKHRDDLDDAVKMMTVFPIEIPVVGKVTGEKYVEHSTLCVIRIKRDNPNDDATYIVSMKRDVADLLINKDTEFASLSDIYYKEFRSKFSYRFYMFTVSIYSAGTISFSFDYIRKIFSNDVEEHKKFVKFDEDVLCPAQKDLLGLYNKGLLHYWFEYHPTAAERRAKKQRGNPEEITFVFHTQAALPKEEVKVISRKTSKEIEAKLIKEFGIFPNSAKEFVMQLTVDNINAFNAKVESIREKMKTAEKNPNGVAFVAFKNFFKEYGNGFAAAQEVKDEKSDGVKSAKEEKPSGGEHPKTPFNEGKPSEGVRTDSSVNNHGMGTNAIDYGLLLKGCAAIQGDLSFLKSPERSIDNVSGMDAEFWRNQWYACKDLMERFGYEIAHILSKMLTFESYDEKSKTLTLTLPGPIRDVEEFIDRHFKETFRNHIIQFFPLDVRIVFTITKYVTKEDSLLKRQLFMTEDKKQAGNTLFHPYYENGMLMDEERWKWNLCRCILAQYMSEQEFNETFAKMELFSWEHNISLTDNWNLSLLFHVPDNETYEKIEKKYVKWLEKILLFIYNKRIRVQYKITNNNM